MNSRYTLRDLLAVVILAVLCVWLLHAAMDARAQTATSATYTFPETVNTQSGGVFVDGAGTVFLVGRSSNRGADNRMVVYANGVLVMAPVEAVGAPSGYIAPDGMLYVTAMDRNQRDIHTYQVEGFVPRSFLSRASSLPSVTK